MTEVTQKANTDMDSLIQRKNGKKNRSRKKTCQAFMQK